MVQSARRRSNAWTFVCEQEAVRFEKSLASSDTAGADLFHRRLCSSEWKRRFHSRRFSPSKLSIFKWSRLAKIMSTKSMAMLIDTLTASACHEHDNALFLRLFLPPVDLQTSFVRPVAFMQAWHLVPLCVFFNLPPSDAR